MPLSDHRTEAEAPVGGPTTVSRTPAELDALLAALRERKHEGGPVDLAGQRLIGADLEGADLASADLSGADLSRCNLKGANLFGAKLRGTTLFEADLSGAELAAADLTEANLEGADLTRAGLGRATLERAQLVRADLSGASLTDARLQGADLRVCVLVGARMKDADLSRADLSRARLSEADLEGCRVDGATFDGVDLRGSRFPHVHGYDEASWIGVDLRDIDFTGAYLCRRSIMDQNYLAEFRGQSRLHEVIYRVWSLTSDCGRSASRWAAVTLVIVLLFSWLYTLTGVDYGDYETRLSPFYYSVVTMTTLGYGDVLPTTTAAQVMVIVQVVTGYVMLGGLLSIFSNKMASRAN